MLTAVLLAALSGPPLTDLTWPQFRGPRGDGIAYGDITPPTEWSRTTNVRWRTPLPGEAWSSPVVVAGRVYLTNAVPEGKEVSLRALCLDAESGAVVWDEEVFREPAGAPKIHSKNSHASPTPVCDGEHLWVHFGHQGTACLTVAGEEVWKTRRYQYQPVHGNGGSPVLVGGKLVFTCDGASDPFVACVDAATGAEVWKHERLHPSSRNFSFSTPTVVDVAGSVQVVAAGSDEISGLDPDTGDALWTVQYEGFSVVPKPMYADGRLYLSTGFMRAKLLCVKPPAGRGAAEILWTCDRQVPRSSSPVLLDHRVWMVSDGGVATMLDAKTGESLATARLEGEYSAALTLAIDLYAVNEAGLTTVLSPVDLDVVSQNDLEERTLATPAFVGESIYLRTAEALYRIQAPEDQ